MPSLWVARDKFNGKLWLHRDKPIRIGDYWWSNINSVSIPNECFPELTWEDQPIEVKITKI